LLEHKPAIVLMGMPGAGKSTVGPALAQLLGWGFIDLDEVIAADVGDVPTFIAQAGIAEFRARERATIASMAPRNCVVSVGGGAVLDAGNRAALSRLAHLVWLRATLDTLHTNVGDGAGRPLLAGGARDALAQLLEERTPIYAECADVTVDVDGLDPNQIAVEVVKAVAQ
jgi:shikimate kinase